MSSAKLEKKRAVGVGGNLCEREYRKPLVDNSSKNFIENSFDSQPELVFLRTSRLSVGEIRSTRKGAKETKRELK